MLRKNREDKVLDSIGYVLILGMLTTLALSAFNLNSYCIVLLLLVTLLKGGLNTAIKNAWQIHFFKSSVLLFIVYAMGVFYSSSYEAGWHDLEKRMGLVVIPFILCSRKLPEAVKWERVMLPFSIILFAISLYCLGNAVVHFIRGNDTEYFFYHKLVSPFSHHAIYFSVLVFITVVFLLEQRTLPWFLQHTVLYYGLIGYFLVFIILLSSKLIIAAMALYALFKLLREKTARLKWYFYVVIVSSLFAFVMFTTNPIKSRFTDIANFDTQKFTSKDLSAAYFNGVEFRLMQWKLVTEILSEKRRWLIGVSSADAQKALNDKYKEYHFYQGEAYRGDKGYLDYNVHNQFLQCLLQSGIIGLLAFLYLCYSLILLGISRKFAELEVCIGLFLAFFFTESVLQTQLGLVSLTLLPLLIYFGKQKNGDFSNAQYEIVNQA